MGEDLKQIKTALIGADLQSGLVKVVAEVRSTVNTVVESHNAELAAAKEKVKKSEKRKWTMIGIIFTLIGLIAGHAMDVYW